MTVIAAISDTVTDTAMVSARSAKSWPSTSATKMIGTKMMIEVIVEAQQRLPDLVRAARRGFGLGHAGGAQSNT